jgi:hypothetical protein
MGAGQVEFLKSGVVDSSGDPLASGKVYFYEPGTTTAKTVWTDQAQTAAASSPVVLDARGAAEIFAEGLYDIKIDTSADVNVDTYDDQFFSDLLVDADVAETSVTNTVTETTIASCDFDGSLMSTTSVLEFFCGFEFADVGVAGTADFDIKAYVNGTEVATFDVDNITGHATQKGVGLVRLTMYGSTAPAIHTEFKATDNAANDADGGTGTTLLVDEICSHEPSIAMDGTDNVSVTCTWATADANYTLTAKGAHVRVAY